MQYKIGEVYDFGGQKRKVIGTDGNYPVTTAVLEFEAEEPVESEVNIDDLRAEIRSELEVEIRAALKSEIRAELEVKIRTEVEAEYTGDKNCTGLIPLIPLDKCNKDELQAIATYIGKDLPSGELSKADITAIILGA